MTPFTNTYILYNTCSLYQHQQGDILLPSNVEMKENIKLTDTNRKSIFQDTPKFTLQCHGFPYMEMLAEEIGCRPNFYKILFTDPKLAIAFCFEVMSATHYRLVGPNSWKQARHNILDMRRRIECPFGEERAKRKAEERLKRQDTILYSAAAILFLLFAFLVKMIFF